MLYHQEKNVTIFDFQDVLKISTKLDNFKDLIHHSKDINEYIIESIVLRKHLLDSINPYKTIDRLKKQVNDYKLRDTN